MVLHPLNVRTVITYARAMLLVLPMRMLMTNGITIRFISGAVE